MNMSEISVVNGVIVEDDKEAGVMHFKPIEDSANSQEPCVADSKSWIQTLLDKLNCLKVKPYVKVRDLTNPIGNRKDEDVGSDKKPSIEAGVKITF